MLYEHQDAGGVWLSEHSKALLGDTPGLGKTRTLIRAMHLSSVRRPLIVCPAIVRTHWRRELDVMQFGPGPHVLSYDQLVRGGNDLMKWLVPQADALILDEAHYLKHATSKRTRQLLGRDGYARRLDTVWAASGTPMPRNPAEIWPLLSTLRPDLPLRYGVKTYAQFVERYCVVRGSMVRGVWREKVVGVKHEHLDELRAMLGEFMLRRDLDDVGLDVPRIDWQLTRLDALTHPIFQQHVDDYKPLLVDGYIATNTPLAEIANEPHVATMRRQLGEYKAPLVVEMLKAQLDADPEMKVAVFAHHRSVLGLLREGLAQFGVSYIDGDTSQAAREAALSVFRRNGPRVFIGQNIACQTGMDGLQRATNRAVLVEPDWTPDVNYQLGHRVARIGAQYEGRAIVQMIALAGTLDEAIVAQNKRETEMVAAVMTAKEAA